MHDARLSSRSHGGGASHGAAGSTGFVAEAGAVSSQRYCCWSDGEQEAIPGHTPSQLQLHSGAAAVEKERPPAAVYLPDGAKTVSIVRVPSPDWNDEDEEVVKLKRFTGYLTDESDSSSPAPSPRADGRSAPLPPTPAAAENEPQFLRAVTVSTVPGDGEEDFEDIALEAASLLPRLGFVRSSSSSQAELTEGAKAEQLYDMVRLGDAEGLLHALMVTDFSHSHIDSFWHNDCTLLQVAASWGHSHIVRMLLLLGADPNLCKHASATATHFAAMNSFKNDEYIEVLRALVSYGANLALKGAGSTWSGEKSPEEVLLQVNRRFAMSNSTAPERRRIGYCLSNMFAFNTSLLPNVTVILGPSEWKHRVDRALENWNQSPPEQRGLILYAGSVPGDMPAYILGARKVPESCVVWAAQVHDTAQAALHAHRLLSHYQGQVFLVTSQYHALCAKSYFEPLFAGRLTVLPCSDDKYDNPKWRTAQAAKLWNDYKGMELSFDDYAVAKLELKQDNAVRMGKRRPRNQPIPARCWQAQVTEGIIVPSLSPPRRLTLTSND